MATSAVRTPAGHGNFNVAATTVMLVDAPSEDAARRGAEKYLEKVHGVEVITDQTDAFESEPLDHPPHLLVHAPGRPAVPALPRA